MCIGLRRLREAKLRSEFLQGNLFKGSHRRPSRQSQDNNKCFFKKEVMVIGGERKWLITCRVTEFDFSDIEHWGSAMCDSSYKPYNLFSFSHHKIISLSKSLFCHNHTILFTYFSQHSNL
jgi:hypothetical protein